MTTTPSSNDLTRQQLEELDALLQRMLAAPTSEPRRQASTVPTPVPPTPAVPPVVESWRIDRPVLVPPRLHLPNSETAEAPVIKTAPLFVPSEPPIPPTTPVSSMPDLILDAPARVPVTPSVPYQPAGTPSDPFIADSVADLEIKADSDSEPIALESAGPLPAIASPKPVADATAGIPLVLMPIYGLNWVAEECLKLFGGESLLQPAAKRVTGILGIAMIIAAIAWILHGYGVMTFSTK